MAAFKKQTNRFVNSEEYKSKYPYNLTLHQLFEEQVTQRPQNIAVIEPPIDSKTLKRRTLTYQQLNDKSNQLAYHLRAKGVGPDTIVGIMAERSLEMIIGLLGILKAGGAYMPISPKNPEKRVTQLLKDSGAKVLLFQGRVQKNIKFTFSGIEIINLELNNTSLFKGPRCNLSHINKPEDLVYVIYTSGSTGKPKGVMIQHLSLVNRLNWMQKKYPLSEGDTILQKTPFFFDVSVWELFWWSLVGARMCFLVPGGERFPQAIIQTVEDSKVTVLHFVPSMMSVFLDYLTHSSEDIHRLKSLKQVFTSGEILSPSHVQVFYQVFSKKNVQLSNLYGPTEATVDVTSFDCQPQGKFEKIPIGKAIDNIEIIITDENLTKMEIGKKGELSIGGVGVARGYLNRPELTSEKFKMDATGSPGCDGEIANGLKNQQKIVQKKDCHLKCGRKRAHFYTRCRDVNRKESRNPSPRNFIPRSRRDPGRLYKTGDYARCLPDGNIEFLGRKDNQVKIHGLRIEIGEIEAAISNHPLVRDCVVMVKQYSKRITLLIGYIIPKNKVTIKELKEFLKMILPDYMIPNVFVLLEEFPLTPNGKINRNGLPEPSFSQ